MSPRFSVITVSYQDSEGLRATLRSARAQDPLGGMEQIVVDGGSNYDVEGLVQEVNAGAVFVSERDRGVYDAMNKGMRLARGEFLIFMNSGDLFATDSVLQEVEAKLLADEPDFVFGDALERLTSGQLIRKTARPLRRSPYGMPTHHQAMFFRRSTIGASGITYDLDYPLASDYDFLLKFLQVSKRSLRLSFSICIFSQGGLSYQNWHHARNEQFHIRRRAYRSLRFASGVYCGQLILGYVRRSLPAVHSYLRGR